MDTKKVKTVRKITQWTGITVLAAWISLFAEDIIEVFKKDTNINTIEVTETKFEVLNKKRESLWEKDLQTQITQYVVEDIDGDNRNELIMGFGETGRIPGHVVVFDRSGNERWNVNTYSQFFPFNGSRSDEFAIVQLLVQDVTGDSKKEIVVLAQDPIWFASRILIFNFQGEQTGDYWHPGRLSKLRLLKDVLTEGSTFIVVYGVNNNFREIFEGSKNSLYHSVIFLLDASNVEGQAPPYHGQVPKGSHKWYRTILPQGRRITSVKWEDNTNRFVIVINDGRIFYLDASGKILGKEEGDKWELYAGEQFDTFYEENEFLQE
ncbi:MAG: hypothetical protein GDA44_12535 [Prochloron sp. SP5CPC1]|nr:hypothetical protein [Candidatus Paraprochloron terpiosi SP5CPC1]